MNVFDEGIVRDWLRDAWTDSRAGKADAHEEGGFVLLKDDGSLGVERWTHGIQDRIEVPPHSGGRRNGQVILATFHTHPNTGTDFEQGPSLTDIRAVRLDPDLRHAEYEGEFVISQQTVYRTLPSGRVEELGDTRQLLGIR